MKSEGSRVRTFTVLGTSFRESKYRSVWYSVWTCGTPNWANCGADPTNREHNMHSAPESVQKVSKFTPIAVLLTTLYLLVILTICYNHELCKCLAAVRTCGLVQPRGFFLLRGLGSRFLRLKKSLG